MTATLGRLIAFAGVPARRVAASAVLGMLAVGFGIALITAAGYLISRAAEQPPILSLTVTIVFVRFFGLARPLARYVDRLVSHDVALSALGRIRTRFYERIEPLAPGQLAGYRRGELLGRMVGDVDALQGLYVRGLSPVLVALVIGAACVAVTATVLPAAAAILALGLLLAGVLVPVLAARLARAAGRRQGAARAELTAELVELLRGAPELVVYGREEDTLAGIRARSDELVRLGRRDGLAAGLAEGLSILIAGLTVAGVLAVLASASVDRVLVATVALLALASFDCVLPLRAAAVELAATRRGRPARARSGRPRAGDPGSGRAASRARAPGGRRARGRDRPLCAGRAACVGRLRPQAGAGAADRARRAERRRQDDGHEPAAALSRSRARPGDGRRPRRARAAAARRAAHVRDRGPERAHLQLDHPCEPRPRAPGRDRRRARGRSRPRAASASGSRRCPTGSTRSSARRGRSSREASVSA